MDLGGSVDNYSSISFSLVSPLQLSCTHSFLPSLPPLLLSVPLPHLPHSTCFVATAVKVCAPVGNSSTTSLNNGGSDRRSVRAVPSALPNGDPSILTDRRNTRPLARGDSRVKSLIGEIFLTLALSFSLPRPGKVFVSSECVNTQLQST